MDHNTPEYLAALETELAHAKHVAPGGQKPNRARVQAIEVEMQRVRAHLGVDIETADGDVLETTAVTNTRRKTTR